MTNFFCSDFKQLLEEQSGVSDTSFLEDEKVLSPQGCPTPCFEDEIDGILNEKSTIDSSARQEIAVSSSPPTLLVSNLVASFNLKAKIDLHKVFESVRNAKLNRARYPGLTIFLKEPKCTGFVFSSGKSSVVGTTSESKAIKASRRLAKLVKRTHNTVKWCDFKICNMLAHGDLGFAVNLIGLAVEEKLVNVANYEPELFPGLVIKLKEEKCTIMVFVSGKIVAQSTASEKELQSCFNRLYPIFVKHKQKNIL